MEWRWPLLGALIVCCGIGAAASSPAAQPAARTRVPSEERFSFGSLPNLPALPIVGDAMHGALLPTGAFEPAPLAATSWAAAESEELGIGPLRIETTPAFNKRGRLTLYRLRDVTLFGGDVVGRIDGKGGSVMLRWKDGE